MPHLKEDEETLDTYKSRNLSTYQNIILAAKKEFGPPERFEKVKGDAINLLRPDELPQLADYATSLQGLADYLSSQMAENLAKLLENFTQVQLVMYQIIDEVKGFLKSSSSEDKWQVSSFHLQCQYLGRLFSPPWFYCPR